MTDYISRKSVLALKQAIGAYGMDISSKEVEAIPAAEVRPAVRGKWIKVRLHDGGVWKSIACSNCKYEPWFSRAEPLYNFCPNCGADMRPTSMSGANGEES